MLSRLWYYARCYEIMTTDNAHSVAVLLTELAEKCGSIELWWHPRLRVFSFVRGLDSVCTYEETGSMCDKIMELLLRRKPRRGHEYYIVHHSGIEPGEIRVAVAGQPLTPCCLEDGWYVHRS